MARVALDESSFAENELEDGGSAASWAMMHPNSRTSGQNSSESSAPKKKQFVGSLSPPPQPDMVGEAVMPPSQLGECPNSGTCDNLAHDEIREAQRSLHAEMTSELENYANIARSDIDWCNLAEDEQDELDDALQSFNEETFTIMRKIGRFIYEEEVARKDLCEIEEKVKEIELHRTQLREQVQRTREEIKVLRKKRRAMQGQRKVEDTRPEAIQKQEDPCNNGPLEGLRTPQNMPATTHDAHLPVLSTTNRPQMQEPTNTTSATRVSSTRNCSVPQSALQNHPRIDVDPQSQSNHQIHRSSNTRPQHRTTRPCVSVAAMPQIPHTRQHIPTAEYERNQLGQHAVQTRSTAESQCRNSVMAHSHNTVRAHASLHPSVHEAASHATHVQHPASHRSDPSRFSESLSVAQRPTPVQQTRECHNFGRHNASHQRNFNFYVPPEPTKTSSDQQSSDTNLGISRGPTVPSPVSTDNTKCSGDTSGPPAITPSKRPRQDRFTFDDEAAPSKRYRADPGEASDNSTAREKSVTGEEDPLACLFDTSDFDTAFVLPKTLSNCGDLVSTDTQMLPGQQAQKAETDQPQKKKAWQAPPSPPSSTQDSQESESQSQEEFTQFAYSIGSTGNSSQSHSEGSQKSQGSRNSHNPRKSQSQQEPKGQEEDSASQNSQDLSYLLDDLF